MKPLFLVLFSILFTWEAPAQDSINQLDENGQRHGLWRKTFEENPSQVRYEGRFEHGKEVGLFKFYQLGQKNPSATKLFAPGTDRVEVHYLNQNGKTISEGDMIGQDRIGQWKYYHQNSDNLMMVEQYENGELNGEKIIYFPNGTATETSHYKDGKLSGELQIFSKTGVLLKKFTYQNGDLHGPTEVFDGKGELLIEGQYKDNQHHGIWKYYENGSLKEQKSFPADN